MNILLNIKRNRIIYFTLVIITVVLGICSRKFASYLPRVVGLYSGDVL